MGVWVRGGVLFISHVKKFTSKIKKHYDGFKIAEIFVYCCEVFASKKRENSLLTTTDRKGGMERDYPRPAPTRAPNECQISRTKVLE